MPECYVLLIKFQFQPSLYAYGSYRGLWLVSMYFARYVVRTEFFSDYCHCFPIIFHPFCGQFLTAYTISYNCHLLADYLIIFIASIFTGCRFFTQTISFWEVNQKHFTSKSQDLSASSPSLAVSFFPANNGYFCLYYVQNSGRGRLSRLQTSMHTICWLPVRKKKVSFNHKNFDFKLL